MAKEVYKFTIFYIDSHVIFIDNERRCRFPHNVSNKELYIFITLKFKIKYLLTVYNRKYSIC